MLVGAFGAEAAFDAPGVVPVDPVVDGVGQVVQGGVVPVAVVEHLVLETAEEALGGGVVGRAALGAHGPGPAVCLHARDPSGPPVVAAPVGVDDGPGVGGQAFGQPVEHVVGQGRVGVFADGVGQDLAVEAVDDRG